MAEKVSQSLDGVSKTLLMTLYARARESQRPDAMLRDDLAVRMVEQLDCDFSHLKMQRQDEIAVIMRMRKFDRHVREFLALHPDGVVVHIGCGLDTRFERVDTGRVEWFDLDMPDVMNLRQRLIATQCDRYHLIASSVFEDDWMDDVRMFKPRPFLFMAEGVFPYFEGEQIKTLFLKLRDNFPGCEMVCDAHTPFVIWADNLQLALARVDARLHWKLKHGRDVEEWGQDISMLEEWFYYEEQGLPVQPYRWMRHVPLLGKSTGIFHYRLGRQNEND